MPAVFYAAIFPIYFRRTPVGCTLGYLLLQWLSPLILEIVSHLFVPISDTVVSFAPQGSVSASAMGSTSCRAPRDDVALHSWDFLTFFRSFWKFWHFWFWAHDVSILSSHFNRFSVLLFPLIWINVTLISHFFADLEISQHSTIIALVFFSLFSLSQLFTFF